MRKNLLARADKLDKLMALRLEICRIQTDCAARRPMLTDDKTMVDACDEMLHAIHKATMTIGGIPANV